MWGDEGCATKSPVFANWNSRSRPVLSSDREAGQLQSRSRPVLNCDLWQSAWDHITTSTTSRYTTSRFSQLLIDLS